MENSSKLFFLSKKERKKKKKREYNLKQSSAKLLVFSAGEYPFYEIFRFPFTRPDWILPVWKGTEWKLGPFIKTREHGRFFSIKVYRDRSILSIDNNASRGDRIITAPETLSFTMVGVTASHHSIHVDPIEK